MKFCKDCKHHEHSFLMKVFKDEAVCQHPNYMVTEKKSVNIVSGRVTPERTYALRCKHVRDHKCGENANLFESSYQDGGVVI